MVCYQHTWIQNPSHGTDQFDQRYAYDFFQIDWNQKGYKFSHVPLLKSLIFGVKLQDTYCWSKPIYAPFDGEAFEVMDGLKERNPVHLVRDITVVLKNGFFFRPRSNKELHPVLGNFIILKMAQGVYSLIAHARTSSIQASKGQKVKEATLETHLPHIYISNSWPILIYWWQKGLPCCSKTHLAFKHNDWVHISNGIPAMSVRIKS